MAVGGILRWLTLLLLSGPVVIAMTGHLVTSGSEIFWSNWRVSVEGGILWVALPLLLHSLVSL